MARYISVIISIIGFIIILGSIGAVDTNTINIKQMFIQIIIGIILFTGGLRLWDICA
jgi:NhaP-type Na+/H+ or K+/H+ antiporter